MASYQVAGAGFCHEPNGEIIVSVPVGQTEPGAVTLRIPAERWDGTLRRGREVIGEVRGAGWCW